QSFVPRLTNSGLQTFSAPKKELVFTLDEGQKFIVQQQLIY
ncbi:20734_t:CDS:2, partial [Racocetra persica]